MKVKPDLSFWKLWNISFGFFGVQIAYALQSANISRIFSTLGADPHSLSYFWMLPATKRGHDSDVVFLIYS
jgi:maltose/moltooligosaccharide transporter